VDWLVREVLKEAGDAAVLEPQDAREAVRAAVRRIGEAYLAPARGGPRTRARAAGPRAQPPGASEGATPAPRRARATDPAGRPPPRPRRGARAGGGGRDGR